MTKAVHVPYTVEEDEDGVWCAHAQLRWRSTWSDAKHRSIRYLNTLIEEHEHARAHVWLECRSRRAFHSPVVLRAQSGRSSPSPAGCRRRPPRQIGLGPWRWTLSASPCSSTAGPASTIDCSKPLCPGNILSRVLARAASRELESG